MVSLVTSIHQKNLKTSLSRRTNSIKVVLVVLVEVVEPCSMVEEWLRRISTKLQQMPLLGNPVITVAPSLATNCQLMLSIRPKVSSKKLVGTEKLNIVIYSLNTINSAHKNRPSSKSRKWLLARRTSIKITLTHWFRSRSSSSNIMFSSLLDLLKKQLQDAKEELSVMSTEIGSRARLVTFRGKTTMHPVAAKQYQTNNSQESSVKVINNLTSSSL